MDLTTDRLTELLGDDAESLLNHKAEKIPASALTLPGPDLVDRVFALSDRSPQVMASLQRTLDTGRLAGTGYLSILPVDQGIEHSAGASFAPNPAYFDPLNLCELAVEGGCNAVASTFGVLGMASRRYAHRLPFICKLNHNESLTYPNTYDQITFGTVRQAWDLGAAGVGATIYFGSPESDRQIVEISQMFAEAHQLGMYTVLWCYLRNSGFEVDGTDYNTAADLSAQADHIGATVGADVLKQKMPTVNGGFAALNAGDESFSKFDEKMYTELTTDHPVDLCRYQVVHGYAGRAGLINSGGSSGDSDLADAVRTAVINKRAGGMGLITGRKAFQRPTDEGAELMRAIQDVYLNDDVTVA